MTYRDCGEIRCTASVTGGRGPSISCATDLRFFRLSRSGNRSPSPVKMILSPLPRRATRLSTSPYRQENKENVNKISLNQRSDDDKNIVLKNTDFSSRLLTTRADILCSKSPSQNIGNGDIVKENTIINHGMSEKSLINLRDRRIDNEAQKKTEKEKKSKIWRKIDKKLIKEEKKFGKDEEKFETCEKQSKKKDMAREKEMKINKERIGKEEKLKNGEMKAEKESKRLEESTMKNDEKEKIKKSDWNTRKDEKRKEELNFKENQRLNEKKSVKREREIIESEMRKEDKKMRKEENKMKNTKKIEMKKLQGNLVEINRSNESFIDNGKKLEFIVEKPAPEQAPPETLDEKRSFPSHESVDGEELEFLEAYVRDEPAIVLKDPLDVIALRGSTAILSVLYRGQPEPTVRWLQAVSRANVFILTLNIHVIIFMLMSDKFISNVFKNLHIIKAASVPNRLFCSSIATSYMSFNSVVYLNYNNTHQVFQFLFDELISL